MSNREEHEKFQKDLNGDVLVRVIESNDNEFLSQITLYQNTSNPVKKRDLKSNDPIQVRLKSEFKRNHWYYETKRGEEYVKLVKTNPSMKRYYHSEVISNEDVAKVIAAVRLGPAVAEHVGSEILFDDLYDKLFTPNITYDYCLAPIYLYKLIKESYHRRKRRFHEFKNSWTFKNPASSYVLNFIHNSIGSTPKWKEKFVTKNEKQGVAYEVLRQEIMNLSSKYFELIYNAWKLSDQPEHRRYLESRDSVGHIEKIYPGRIRSLGNKASEAILEYLHDEL